VDTDVDYAEEDAEEESTWVWSRFCAAIYDSLAKNAARDLVSFRSVCEKLWRPFVQPIVDRTFGTRDFSRLMVSRRSLFQQEDCLLDNIVSAVADGEDRKKKAEAMRELPYYSKWLLCAAYLASYNPAKQDQLFFMKATERKRRRKASGASGRVVKHRKIPRHLLAPSSSSLDRLLAILHAILPHTLPQTADLMTQIATLGSLRLLIRTGASGGDLLDMGGKWRVNCGWDVVHTLGRNVGFDIGEYLAGGGE